MSRLSQDVLKRNLSRLSQNREIINLTKKTRLVKDKIAVLVNKNRESRLLLHTWSNNWKMAKKRSVVGNDNADSIHPKYFINSFFFDKYTNRCTYTIVVCTINS